MDQNWQPTRKVGPILFPMDIDPKLATQSHLVQPDFTILTLILTWQPQHVCPFFLMDKIPKLATKQ